ncbi:MAG: hypothetical protein R6V47_07770 [Candidatus Delongbacteria bacterium]
MLRSVRKKKKESAVKILNTAVDFFTTNITTKLIFFFIGVMLWFNINLQKDFEMSVDIPIRLSNIREGKTVLEPIPDKARIKIRSTGRHLLLSDLGKDVYFEIDASGIEDSMRIRINNDYFINTSGKDIEPLFIFHPQEIDLKLDDLLVRKVPVKLNAGFTLAAGYTTTGEFVFSPESLTVSGPAEIVKKINSIPTKKTVDRELKEDYYREVKLVKQNHSSLSYTADKVKVYQKIVRKGSNTFKAPVSLENLPSGKNFLIDPIAIDISVTGPVNELQNIGAEDFSVTADASKIDDLTGMIPLTVTSEIGLDWKYSTEEVRAILY